MKMSRRLLFLTKITHTEKKNPNKNHAWNDKTAIQQPWQKRGDDDCRWTRKRNALTLHELSSENADNVSLLTDPGSPSRLYLILPQHAFLLWDDKTPKHIDHQWLNKKSADRMIRSSLKCPHSPPLALGAEKSALFLHTFILVIISIWCNILGYSVWK